MIPAVKPPFDISPAMRKIAIIRWWRLQYLPFKELVRETYLSDKHHECKLAGNSVDHLYTADAELDWLWARFDTDIVYFNFQYWRGRRETMVVRSLPTLEVMAIAV